MRQSMMIRNNYLIWETMQQHRTRQTQKIHAFTIINCTWLGINIQKIWRIFSVDVNFKPNLHSMEEYKAKQVFQNLNLMWRTIYSKCKYHSKIKQKKSSFFHWLEKVLHFICLLKSQILNLISWIFNGKKLNVCQWMIGIIKSQNIS